MRVKPTKTGGSLREYLRGLPGQFGRPTRRVTFNRARKPFAFDDGDAAVAERLAQTVLLAMSQMAWYTLVRSLLSSLSQKLTTLIAQDGARRPGTGPWIENAV